MKRIAGFAVLATLFLTIGCSQKRQLKVIFRSVPPSGTLYTQNGELLGTCPKTLWYDIDSEAIKDGYLDAKGMIVRWPTGPERRSSSLIRLTVDGTNRDVIFLQPEYETETPTGDLQVDVIEELDKKTVAWQKARKAGSIEIKQTSPPLALTSKKPIAANKSNENLSGIVESNNYGILTLEPEHLMLLDWDSLNRRGHDVKTRLSGSGVEFEIHFLGNDPGSCSRRFVSSGSGGRGDLVGADVSDYEQFALKLTLVSINGKSDPDIKQKLVVGAVIGPTADGFLTSYEPVTLSLAASERVATVITRISTDKIYEIGFLVYVEYHQDWDARGSTVILRVESAEGADASAFNTLSK